MVAGVAGVVALLSWNQTSADPASPDFVTSVPWIAWKTVAAVAVMVFVLLLVAGLRALVRNDQALGPGRWTIGYAVAAAALAGGLILLVTTSGGRNPDLPVQLLPYRTRFVLVTGLAAAVPWLTLAWLCRDACRPEARRPWRGAPRHGFADLLRLWQLISHCVGAFAVAVVAAILTSGALRTAFLSVATECGADRLPVAQRTNGLRCAEDFPSTDVLLYGAAFAVLLLTIAVPLVVAWRQRALEWVAAQQPPIGPAAPDEGQLAESARLRRLLHLDTSVLRDPLTLLSIFTPLVTSVLAAFVPELGT